MPLNAFHTLDAPKPITTPSDAVPRILAKLFTVAPPGNHFGVVEMNLDIAIMTYTKLNLYL